jgi:hypothetical protein
MSFNAVEALGISEATVERMSPAQRELLHQLTEHEVAVITSVQQRFNAVSGEVTGQSLSPDDINFGCIVVR